MINLSKFHELIVTRLLEYETELEFEIIKSEKIRTLIVLTALDIYLVVGSIFAFILPPEKNPINVLFENKFPYIAVLIIMGCATVYELLVYAFLSYAIKKEKRPPLFWQYANATIESLIVTSLLIVISNAVNASITLNSSFFLAYYYFIVLSTLKLNPRVALFIGIINAAGYAGVAEYYLPNEPEIFPQLNSQFMIISRSGMIFATGLIAAIVAYQLRLRIKDSIRSIEEKNELKSIFGKYVSPEIVQKLLDQKNPFEGEVRWVSIMFLDIRGFTTFCESRHPSEIINYLNQVFSDLIAEVNKNNGVINKFLGDGFMAVFGAPIDDGKDAENAMTSALAIRLKLHQMNFENKIPATRIGIGLHRGEVVTGNVGSDERREYTIIGDTVNLASRIEQLTKQYHTDLLFSEEIFSELTVDQQSKCKQVAEIQVRGREEKTILFSYDS